MNEDAMSMNHTTRDDGEQLRSAALRRAVARRLAVMAIALAPVLLQAPAAHAINCLPPGEPLVKIPEIVSDKGVLHGTMVLTAERQRMVFRSPVGGKSSQPGVPAASYECREQIVRAFHRYDGPQPDSDSVHDPVPGPTLRAHVGDIIELTFVNDVDANRFGRSIDQGEKRNISGIAQNPAAGCDTINTGTPGMGYPYTGPTPFLFGDTFPDCFHGSSTGNIHFHGTHTNPTGTGDDVLLEIRPSPRVPKPGSTTGETIPTITPPSVEEPFKAFFMECEKQLNGDVHSEWPANWDEAPLGPWTTPGTWTAHQASLLQAYDAQTKEDLWGANKKVIDKKQWPQYYIGAFPYCFRIPAYTYASWPPPPGGLRMGQAPGTHWYHAHKHGSTAIDVANGMTGAFIIEGKYDDDLNNYYGAGWTRTQPVMVINQLGVSPNLARSAGTGSGQQDKGPDFVVNGRSQPMVDMAAGEVQLWRIVNSSGRSGAYFASLPPGFQWMQLAQDGVQFADENYQKSLNKPFLIAAGNRVDLLVMAPSPGTYAIQVQHEVAAADLVKARPVVLLQVRVRADVPAASGVRATFIPKAPEQPPFLTNITDAEVASTINNPRVITFASTPPPNPPTEPNFAQHTINGHKFDGPGDAPIPVTLDAVEEWKIVNATYAAPISHPFHIHLNPFQIVEVFDPNETVTTTNNHGVVPKYVTSQTQVVDANTQCVLNLQQDSTWFDCHKSTANTPRIWWDVFPIPTGAVMTDAASGQSANVPGYFRMRSRFVDFPGNYVLHCHILAHEDRGMMSIVELKAANAPDTAVLYHHH
jgi:FtsP/CotA-like multicopper oxidase with cupredoxin domain